MNALCQQVLHAVPARLIEHYSVSVRESDCTPSIELRLVPHPYKEGHAVFIKSYGQDALTKMPADRLENMVAADVAEMVVLLDAKNAGIAP